jgi:hypothetical protein
VDFVGGDHSLSRTQLSTAVGYPGLLHGGTWRQLLNWRRGDPRRLQKGGIYHKEQVLQVNWLEREAQEYFGARRCVGLAGSYRNRSIPIAGSLLWSLLHYGT